MSPEDRTPTHRPDLHIAWWLASRQHVAEARPAAIRKAPTVCSSAVRRFPRNAMRTFLAGYAQRSMSVRTLCVTAATLKGKRMPIMAWER